MTLHSSRLHRRRQSRTRGVIDRDEARHHLALLDPDRTVHIFAAFPEAAHSTARPRQLVGTLDDVLQALDVAQQDGCGVFVAVNAMRGRRRRNRDVAAVRAVFAERDRPGTPLPLRPSLVVETSPGKRHDYLLCDATDPPDLVEARRINRLIASRYGCDCHATDLARVLRLAGSLHLKGEPHRVGIAAAPGTRYPASTLRAALPVAPKPDDAPRIIVRHAIAHPDRYIAAALAGLLGELASARAGTRNATLNRIAFRLGLLRFDYERTAALLTPAALAIGLGAQETLATIRSGHAAGAGAAKA